MTDPRHVVVAMSGGVDSAVAAALLVEQGYRVTGLFMNNGVYPDDLAAGGRTCCSRYDARDAGACARILGIEFFELDFRRDFARIIDHFADEYRHGRTPNPCIDCNQQLKLGKLLTYAASLDAGAVATGHYARRVAEGDRWHLRRPADVAKDQTYVLFGLSQRQLARTWLPLGELTKPEVRRVAARVGLPVRDKPESQDICFVPGGDYREVLARRGVGSGPGEIRATDGRVVGRHDGVEGFTIGQRRGLGVALGTPHYVVGLDADSSTVVVGPRAALGRASLVVARVNWMRCPGLAAGESLRAGVQIRYHHLAADATVTGRADGRVEVCFDAPQDAVTPGQAACFYDADGAVLGGGWIV